MARSLPARPETSVGARAARSKPDLRDRLSRSPAARSLHAMSRMPDRIKRVLLRRPLGHHRRQHTGHHPAALAGRLATLRSGGLILSDGPGNRAHALEPRGRLGSRDMPVDVSDSDLSMPGPGGAFRRVHYRPGRRRRGAAAGLLPRRRLRHRRARDARRPVRGLSDEAACTCCRSTTASRPSTRRPRAPTTPTPRTGGPATRRRAGRRPRAGWPSAATARAATSPRWCRCGRATRARRCPSCSCCSTRSPTSPAETRSQDVVRRRLLPRRGDMDWSAVTSTSAARGVDATDPRVSPLLADDLSGLPPALLVTAGFDPLARRGQAVCRRACARGRRRSTTGSTAR